MGRELCFFFFSFGLCDRTEGARWIYTLLWRRVWANLVYLFFFLGSMLLRYMNHVRMRCSLVGCARIVGRI